MKTTYDIMEMGTSYPVLTYTKNMGYKQNVCVDFAMDMDENLQWNEYTPEEWEMDEFREQCKLHADAYGFTMDDLEKCKAYIHEDETDGIIVLVWS